MVRRPAEEGMPTVPPSSSGQQRACEKWLMAMMRFFGAATQTEIQFGTDACTRFPGLSERGFGKAWQRTP